MDDAGAPRALAAIITTANGISPIPSVVQCELGPTRMLGESRQARLRELFSQRGFRHSFYTLSSGLHIDQSLKLPQVSVLQTKARLPHPLTIPSPPAPTKLILSWAARISTRQS